MEPNTPRTKRFKESTGIGVLFLLIGGALLLRQSGYPFPSWLFSWEMIVIAFGLFVGIKNGFRDFSWLIFIIIGGFFLCDNIWPGFRFQQYMWPVILIALGLMFILAPKGPCKRHQHMRDRMRQRRMGDVQPYAAPGSSDQPASEVEEFDNTNETNLDIASIFGGIKKKVLSKQFTGGEIVCIFGGAQINLANADFQSPITLDLVQIFGGTKLVVPANWEVRSEVATIFGGLDDKRPQPVNSAPEKILIIQGTIIFGGVEVNTF